MFTHTFFKPVLRSLFVAALFFGSNATSFAQGCEQVEIGYEQPDCFKSKNGGAPSGNRACTPVGVCANQPYTYMATGGPWATYLWAVTSGPSSPTISPSNTATNVSINWTVPGTYILTLTVTDGLGNTYSKCIEVTANAKPVAGFNFAPNNGCAGSVVNFTNSTTFSGTPYYSWDFGDPASGANNNSNATNPTHIYNTAGSYTITLIAYSSILVPGGGGSSTGGGKGDSLTLVTCCADTIKKTVTVVNGNVKIECISTVCAGAIAKYTAVGCVSPTWGTPVGGTVISTSGNTIMVQWGSGNPQGQLSVSCGGGCTAYATVPIVPTTTIITGNTSPCNTAPASYTVPYLPGTSYTWTLTNVTTSSPANNLLSTYPDNNTVWIDWSLATPNNTYQLSINLNNQHLCCTSTGSLTIIPKQLYTISGPSTICQGQTGLFTPNFAGTFTWSALPSPPLSATGGTYNPVFANVGAYVITATNGSGTFCNATASTSTNVIAVPLPGTILGPNVGCAGSTYAYNMSTPAPTGYFYEWTITNGTFQPAGGTNTTGDNVNIQWTSLSATITVVLKQSAAPNCSVPAGIRIVNAATVGSISGPTSVCVDGTATYVLTGGTLPPGTNVNWFITPSSSLGTIISGQGTSSITVLWHGQGGSGPWGPATINASTGCGNATPLGGIMIYPKFTLSITPGGTDICQGGVSLTANGPAGASYVWSPGGSTSQTLTGIITPGTYTATATLGGCNASAFYAVQDPFAIAPVTCGVGICNVNGNTNENLGIKVIMPGSGTFTYEWHSGTCTSPGPILQTTTTGATSNNFLAPTDGNYCVIVKYGSCQKCFTFLVKKVCCPDVNHPAITNKTQVSCDEWSFTGVTPNPTGASITWDFGDGTSAAGTSGVAINHIYSLPGVYCVTFCVGAPSPNPTSCTGNCTATDAFVPLAPGFTYTLGCNGCLNVTNATVIYGPPATVTYAWDFGDGGTSTAQNPGQHCYTTGGSKVVQLKVTYTNGTITCAKTVQQMVIYTPLSITNSSPVCTGTPVNFASSPGGFLTYFWTFGDGFTGYISPILHAYNASGSFTANLSVTDALGNTCTASTPITVNPGISNCTILPAYICPGSTATLTGPAGSFSYSWQVETTPNVFVAAPGVNNAANYSTVVPGNYRVIVTNINGCTCISNKVAVTAVAKPKATFSIAPSKNLCSPGGVVTLTAPAITGYTYAWYANGGGSPIGASPTLFQFVSVTTIYNLVVMNQYGCKDTCSMTITFNPLPAAPLVSASSLCAGVAITLSVSNYASNISWNTGATTTSIVTYTAGAYVATYTDPATGCSASTVTTINKRPSAGLFPHSCDSIPCKCSRPFVIYAPNSLIGNFNSGYIYNWWDAITNTFLFAGNPYSNGGLGVQTGSYVVVITDANTGCKDTSNSYSLIVPPCDTCSCKNSYWGELTLAPADNPVGNNTGVISVKCGGKYNIECNKPYSLSAFYNCSGGTKCAGKVTYTLQPPIGIPVTGTGPTVSFTPTITGVYTLTLYGWCGPTPCDSCVIKFKVDCPCDCKGSKWGDIALAQNSETDPTGNAVITPPTFLSCNKTYKLDCNKSYTVNPSFICKDPACKGKVTYSLQPPIGIAITGNAPVTFTPTINGTYTLTLYGWCGPFICDSCVIKFDVVCGCNCAESVWGDVILTQPVNGDNPTGTAVITNPQTLKCGKTYDLDCKKTYSINASFICKDPECKGKVTYMLVPPSGPVVLGTTPLSFTTSLTGIYTLTLYGWCGDKICDSCVIKFKVDCACDCKGSKWGDKTISNGTTTAALNCKLYDWTCNQPFTINATYVCAKPFCNSATTYQLITPSGSPVNGSLPLTYTPTATGTYTLVLYGYCGSQVCDSCVVTFKVTCPPVCCKYDIKVKPGTVSYVLAPAGNATIASESFTITGLTGVLLSEVRAEVVSFDISSNFDNECMACKAYPFLWASINSAGNIGAVPGMINLYNGSTTSLFNPTGAAVYLNPREVVWNNGTNFLITGPIGMNFFLPLPPLIDCCQLKGRICVKFTFRDINCNECEVISCFDVVIK